MTLLLAVSLFLTDGPLELSGWTLRQDCPRDRMYVQDGVLHCEYSPGEANAGIAYGIDVPFYERGEVSYEIMPRAMSSGTSSDFYMPIQIGNMYLFLQNKGMLRICDDRGPRYFGVGANLFEPAKWIKVRVVWDNVKRRIKYYVGDMSRPDKIEYDCTMGSGLAAGDGNRMQIRIYNYARAQVTETHLIRDFEVKEYVPPSEDVEVPRTKALVFRGLTSAYFPLAEWTKDFAAEDVVKFNLDYPGACITTKNANALNALPDEDIVSAAKLIVLCDIPLKTGVLPYPVQEDILDAVRKGARLVVTAGYAGLEKGEGYDSPIMRELPVTVGSPWEMPVPKDGKAVRYCGKGEISVVLSRMMLEDEEFLLGDLPADVTAASARGLTGEWRTFDGTGDWPTSGNVIVTAPVAADSAGKAAAVARWEQVYLDENAGLAFSGLASPVEISANFKGRGSVSSVNCAAIALSGDSREYAGSATWSFERTAVHIGGEYALGPGGSGHRLSMVSDDNGKFSRLTIGWSGQKAYTNHVAVEFRTKATEANPHRYQDAAQDAARRPVVGSRSADERFVQDADMLMDMNGSTMVHTLNNYEQISGRFGRVWEKNWGFALLQDAASESFDVRFSGTSRLVVGYEDLATQGGEAGAFTMYGQHLQLAGAGTHIGSLAMDTGILTIEGKSALDDYLVAGRVPELAPRIWKNPMYSATVDLGGCDLSVGRLNKHYYGDVTEDSVAYYEIRSGDPAMLVLENPEFREPTTMPALFSGAVSLKVANGLTNDLATVVSETDGALVLTDGTLGFKWGGGWRGEHLEIGGSGVLRASVDTVLSFATATVDGIELHKGDYTIAELKDLFPGHFEGEATATVSVTNGWQMVDGTGEWPTSGRVKLASGVVVGTDEQRAAVAGWTHLWLMDGSSLTFQNLSGEAVLNAQLRGTGAVGAVGSRRVTLTGDNRAYAGTGDWVFENTALHIGSEWALGTKSDNHRVVLKHAIGSDLTDMLTIGWPEQNSFTNHTHIVWQAIGEKIGTVNSLEPVIGPSAANQWFVQDGDMLYLSNYSPRFTFQGQYEQMSGRIGRAFEKAWPIYFYQKAGRGDFNGGPAVARFTGTGRIVCGSETEPTCNIVWCGNALVLEFGSGAGNHVASINYASDTIRLLADDALNDSVIGAGIAPLVPTLLDQTTYRNELDLNGHGIKLGGLHHIYSSVPSETSRFYAPIHSERPATITLADPKPSEEDFISAVEISGPVSMVVDNCRTNVLTTRVSSSTGLLTVRKGSTLAFRWGAGWTGSVMIDGGVLLAESPETFNGAADLTLTNSGILVLGSGAELMVGSVSIGGVALEDGSHSGAQLKAKYPGWILGDDEAVLKVGRMAFGRAHPQPDNGSLSYPIGLDGRFSLMPVNGDQDEVEFKGLGDSVVEIPLQIKRVRPIDAVFSGQIVVKSGKYDVTPALLWATTGEYATYALHSNGVVTVWIGDDALDVPVTPMITADDRITIPFVVDATTVSITVETIPGLYYTLMRSTSLAETPTPIGMSLQARGGPLMLSDGLKPTACAFYRIAVTLDPVGSR